MARILIADDDAGLLDVLALAFEDAGHEVARAADGLAAHARARGAPAPDLLVSDVNMPGLDGFALCRKLRAEGSALPIVLLTSRDNEIDQALGLELGADDYVIKPFSTRVLLARVAALLRRDELRRGALTARPPLSAGPLTLDTERLTCTWRGAAVALTVTELRLLEGMARRPGVVHPRTRLMALARDDDSVVEERIVDTYVRRLRRKFEAVDADFRAIETVVGAGYRFVPP